MKITIEGKEYPIEKVTTPVIVFEEWNVVGMRNTSAHVAGQHHWEPITVISSSEVAEVFLKNQSCHEEIRLKIQARFNSEEQEWKLSSCWMLHPGYSDGKFELVYKHAEIIYSE